MRLTDHTGYTLRVQMDCAAHGDRWVTIGDIVRAAKTDFRLPECFDLDTNSCTQSLRRQLKPRLQQVLSSRFADLDSAMLADVTQDSALAPPARHEPASGVAMPSSRRSAHMTGRA